MDLTVNEHKYSPNSSNSRPPIFHEHMAHSSSSTILSESCSSAHSNQSNTPSPRSCLTNLSDHIITNNNNNNNHNSTSTSPSMSITKQTEFSDKKNKQETSSNIINNNSNNSDNKTPPGKSSHFLHDILDFKSENLEDQEDEGGEEGEEELKKKQKVESAPFSLEESASMPNLNDNTRIGYLNLLLFVCLF